MYFDSLIEDEFDRNMCHESMPIRTVPVMSRASRERKLLGL